LLEELETMLYKRGWVTGPPNDHPEEVRLFDQLELTRAGDGLPPYSEPSGCAPLPPEPPPPETAPDGPGRPETPLIFVVAGERHKAADRGICALRQAGVPFYNRAGELVWIDLAPAKTSNGATIKVPAIRPLSLPALGRALGQVARWRKYVKEGVVTIDPPKPVVEQIAVMSDRWGFPPLQGLTRMPLLRPDYTLLERNGYDHATGLFADFGGLVMPRIPARPSRVEAETALALILSVFEDFPFVDERSRAVAVAGMITPCIRAAIPVSPLFLIVSPTPATGKSYLVDCNAAVATGAPAAVIAVAPKEEETEKRLIAAALSGNPIPVLDNVRKLLQGDFLCQVTERPLMELRPLGTSEPRQIKNIFTPFANGINLVAADDMVRRGLQCRLDADVERPELRKFDRDPRAEILADRGRYIAACLTLARYYIAAGMPNKLPPLASYGPWSDLVRSPLVHLGLADPADSQEALRGDDPVVLHRNAVFATWRELRPLIPGDPRGCRTNELIREAEDDQNGELLEQLLEISEGQGVNAGKIDRARLGRWLLQNENTIAAGVKLVCDRSDKSRPRWRLVPVEV